MNDLTEALGDIGNPPYEYQYLPPIIAAVHRQLALEPDKCWQCEGRGRVGFDPTSDVPVFVAVDQFPCNVCHGRGWLYKPETVEAVGSVIHGLVLDMTDYSLSQPQEETLTVAVLDALRALDQEAPNGD
jgi:hypothetical protein